MGRVAFFLMLAMIATPALAQGSSIAIPEPTDLALFALAVAGLVIGRRSSRRPPQDRDEP